MDIGDAAGLLLVIDRLGRTIAELEQRNIASEQHIRALEQQPADTPSELDDPLSF